MQIYGGNLPVDVDDVELKAMFTEFGEVLAASIGKEVRLCRNEKSLRGAGGGPCAAREGYEGETASRQDAEAR